MAYRVQDVAAALRETKGMIYLAAKILGCEPKTIYNHLERHPSLRTIITQERGEFVDIGELKLYQAVQSGQPWAVSLLLRTLGKDRGYVERQEQTGKDGEGIDINVHIEPARDRISKRLADIASRKAESTASNGHGTTIPS